MFLNKYMDDIKLNLLYDVYEDWYIEGLDEENFIQVYNLLKAYNFYFIDDIILNFLEIFEMDVEEVNEGLLKLKDKLGDKFVYIIGHDMSYLNEI